VRSSVPSDTRSFNSFWTSAPLAAKHHRHAQVDPLELVDGDARGAVARRRGRGRRRLLVLHASGRAGRFLDARAGR